MIKIINDKETEIVKFIGNDNKLKTGKLLTYEITGEACVQLETEKEWIPFSKLSLECRSRLSGVAVGDAENPLAIKDPKVMIAITMAVLIFFSYYYVLFNA